jgi:hypothetical protein
MENNERQIGCRAGKEDSVERMQGFWIGWVFRFVPLGYQTMANLFMAKSNKALSTSTTKPKQTPSPLSRMR